MGVGAFVEPLIVVSLLVGGTWINRKSVRPGSKRRYRAHTNRLPATYDDDVPGDVDSGPSSPEPTDDLLYHDYIRSASPSLIAQEEYRWRTRHLRACGWSKQVTSPNTQLFRNTVLSRLLRRFPFLVEAWYWALIYWVYQLGRAFTAVTLNEGTVHVARKHALQLIKVEERLHIFWELHVQKVFLQHPILMTWTNRIYSYIHIPATILFLICLYYFTITSDRKSDREDNTSSDQVESLRGPALYEARRRTMAMCNLLAFIVFTVWPCMPPRLLSDKSVKGPSGDLARSYGFVDTVHSASGAGSVWTSNKFCNQWAAMPSLHFGYSLLIGLTVMMVPLSPQEGASRHFTVPLPGHSRNIGISQVNLPSRSRVLCVVCGILYPLIILLAIIATANHFILDAVAGAMVCGLGWAGNRLLLNLLFLEDYFLWCLRIHKPAAYDAEAWAPVTDEAHGWAPNKGPISV